MDRALVVVLVLFFILAALLFFLSSQTAETSSSPPLIEHNLSSAQSGINTPSEPSRSPPLASDPLVEKACTLYRRDVWVMRPASFPPYECLLDCNIPPRGWCPEAEYFYTCILKYVRDESEALAIYRAVRRLYNSLRLGTGDVASSAGLTTFHYHFHLSRLSPYLKRFIEERNTAYVCEGVKRALRKI